MKRIFTNWFFQMSLILIAASALAYTAHYFIFQDAHHIFIYMLGDIGFLFLDVLLVILFIERILSRREKQRILKKLNMVIGTFFSEVGLELLRRFSDFVEDSSDLEKKCEISAQWTKKNFIQAAKAAKEFKYTIHFDAHGLSELHDFFAAKHGFMIRLLENPNLLENEDFTDLLWAVFHLSEELAFRNGNLENLPDTDISHLKGDLRRAYSQITSQWLHYSAHLKEKYPFLFSLAARINPMNPKASALVTS